MKTLDYILLIIVTCFAFNARAQNDDLTEDYETALNIGVGIGGYSGYFGNVGKSLPVLNINYEFSVADNFSIAPTISFYTYKTEFYRGVVIPTGVKCSYLFDELLNAGNRWDFYLASSLGFSIVNIYWDSTYTGPRDNFITPRPMFLDIHVGTEYHITNRIGAFMDLSTGVSTIGFAFH